jgi:predicted nuclease of predicted toxin-antitoxin system
VRILADENIDPFLVDWLRAQGHDVSSIRESARGTPDSDVLDAATREQRVLLTADKDFGDLVYRQGRPTAGVILLRFRTGSRLEYFDLFIRHFPVIARTQPGRFVIAGNHGVRVRPLPWAIES